MRVDVMRPTHNFEPQYRVMVLTREDWTMGPGTPPIVKGDIWFTDGSQMGGGGLGPGSMGNPLGEGLAFPSGDTPQFYRPKCLPFWPVHMILKFMEHQRNR
jgi:hypothetical protein